MFYSGSIYHVRLCAGLSRLSALLFHGKSSIMTSQQWQIRIWNDRWIARMWRFLRTSMNFRDLYKTLRNSKILVIVNMEIQHGGWKIFIWSFILRCIHSDWSICFRFSHRSVFSLHFKTAYEIFILCPPTLS